MDKNEILSDKEKYFEKFQRLLNNCSSGDINQYIFEKNLELLTIDLEKKYLIVLNVHKAYDFVMLDILDQFIQNDPYFTNSEKEQWQEELKDLSALNIDISGNIIYRSQGIFQESELAPYLLNYYMSRILEDPIIIKLLQDCEFTIYADNIFIANNFDNEEMCRKLVVNLNNAFNKYNFSFKREYRIFKIGGFDFPNEIIKIDEIDNHKCIKTIGMKSNTTENQRQILKFNEAFLKSKYKPSDSGYKMFNITKKYIIAKCNFYNSLLYTKYLKKVNKDWFKRELRNWLKANLVKFPYLDNGIIKIRSIFNKYSLDINKNKCEIKSINYISKNIKENRNLNDYFDFQNKNNRYGIKYEKIKKLYEKINCVFFFVDSEYIIFIL